MTEAATRYTLADLLWGLGARYGERPALVSGSRRITFRSVPGDATRLAHALSAQGLRPGDQIGIALRDSFDYLRAIFACWSLGAVAVPMDFRSSGEERARLASDFDLMAVIQDRRLPGSTYTALIWDTDVAAPAEAMASAPADAWQTGPVHPALISLTSGTTGAPQGMVVTHDALLVRMMGYGYGADLPGSGRFMCLLPLSFSASRNHAFANLFTGSTVVFRPILFSAQELLQWAHEDRPTFIFAVGAMVQGLLDAVPEGASHVLPGAPVIYTGGSAMPSEAKIAAYRRLSPNFLHCYASSVSGTVSMLSGEDILRHPDSSGRPLPHMRVEIVGDDHRPLPLGETGIVRVRSPGMAENLYRSTDRPGGDKLFQGWSYPGDYGLISDDGLLTIVGRTSDMIIRGGANVYPAEVERVLESVPGVREAAVVGVPDPQLGEDVAAFVVADGVSEAALRGACLTRLTPDKRPRHIVFVEALPRNANGKVLKRTLRDGLAGDARSSALKDKDLHE